MHEAICPVCYLTSRDTGSESRRPFALQPPLSRQSHYDLGERFGFGFTLFGNANALLPYILLAVREVGETHGIGRRLDAGGERGRYRLIQVSAHDPHGALAETLYREPDTLIAQPTLAVTGESIARRAAVVAAIASADDNRVQIRLNTPLRLIHQNRLMREFSAVAFFQRLIERKYGLGCYWQMKKSARGRRKCQHFGFGRQNAIIEKVSSWPSKKSAPKRETSMIRFSITKEKLPSGWS